MGGLQRAERDRESALQPPHPVAPPLPAEVLQPHPDLRGDRRLPLAHGRLAVLLAREHVPQRLPAGRLPFVDRWEVGGANRQEQVHGETTTATPSTASA